MLADDERTSLGAGVGEGALVEVSEPFGHLRASPPRFGIGRVEELDPFGEPLGPVPAEVALDDAARLLDRHLPPP